MCKKVELKQAPCIIHQLLSAISCRRDLVISSVLMVAMDGFLVQVRKERKGKKAKRVKIPVVRRLK